MNNNEQNPITSAESAIARTLRDLEASTGETVDSLSIETLNVTQFGDKRPTYLRAIRITLRVAPPNNWSV